MPRMPGLMTCQTLEETMSAVADVRPDVVIVGSDFQVDHLRSMAANLATSGMGLALVGLANDEVARRFTPTKSEFRRIGIEPFDRPVQDRDVVLRLRGLLRRCRPAALSGTLAHGDMVLDEGALTVAMGGNVAPLALENYRILAPLFDDPDHVWTREELLPLVYGSLSRNSMRTVDVKLNVTRRRLRAVLGTDPVQTVRGLGYRLAASR